MTTSTHRLSSSGPEPFEACPDGGRCWHACPLTDATPEHPEGRGVPCWRVTGASPMGRDDWTAAERAEHTDAHALPSGNVTDDDLAALTAEQRRVVRLMHAGGWQSGRPGLTAVKATCKALGLGYAWQSEHVRGEPTAYWPADGTHATWAALSDRLDYLPRRKASRKPAPPLVLDTDEDVRLTRAETAAIRSLKRLAKTWPPSLRLVSMDGSLYVIRTADERFHSEDGATRTKAVIADINGIPNEGGGW